MEWRTAFVGREREIATVRSLLEKTRLLTLTGAGGIGKTRLALEAVRRTPGEFAGDVIVVELASVRDPAQLLAAIATVLGFRETGAVDPFHVLAEHLGRNRTLLLLDNFEQIVSAAPAVGELLDATPSLVVIVTSRVRLHLSGEQEYQVPALELPSEDPLAPQLLASVEAVELFVERARMVRPDFELTAENAVAVAEICRRVDGLPLAIELAASRLKVLTPRALLKRLDQRLAILTGGAADVPERQRTLRATIAWSYELLPALERGLLLRCAVFVGGFTLDAARAVSSEEEADDGILDELGLLVDHNLVTASTDEEGEPRFGMLETIREFAADELEPRQQADVRRRHAQHFTELAEAAASRLQGPEHARWLAQLNSELDNIRVALAWASTDGDEETLARLTAAMAPYWRYYGDIREAQRWLATAMAVRDAVPQPVNASLTRAIGWIEAVAGNLARGEQLLIQALTIWEQEADDAGIADTLYHLGATQSDLHRLDDAQRTLERGLIHAHRAGDLGIEGRLLLALAMIAGEMGDHEKRRELVRRAMDASSNAGDMQRLGLGLDMSGWDAWAAGDRMNAIAQWSRSVRLLRDWGERAFLGSILMPLSYGLLEVGRPEIARDVLLESIQLTRQAGAVPDVIEGLAHVAYWLVAVGATDRAAVQSRIVERICDEHGVSPDQAWPLPEVRRALKGYESAVDTSISLEQALDEAQRDMETTVISHPSPAPSRGPRFDLTPRELEVLHFIAAGLSNAEIGEALFISRKTASVHVANIKDKLGAGSRVEIATMALQAGLVDEASRVS